MCKLHGDFVIRAVAPGDAPEWEVLRRDLWPDSAENHAEEIAMFFGGILNEPIAVLVAENVPGDIVGFVELSVRDNVPGLEGKRTGYVEGLYIRPEFRSTGIVRRLLRVSRLWACQQRCTALAGDRANRTIIDKSF